MARKVTGIYDFFCSFESVRPSGFPFTISARIRPNGWQTVSTQFLDDTNGGFNPGLSIQASATSGNVIQFKATANNSSAVTGNSYAVGTWYRVTGIFNSATNRQIYCDNTKGTDDSVTANFATLGRMSVGNGSNGPKISFADIGVWNIALTTDDIAQLTKGFSCQRVRPQNLLSHFPAIRNPWDLRAASTNYMNTAPQDDHPRIYL